MSGSIYNYSDSDYEMVDPLKESWNRTPESGNSSTVEPEPTRRAPVASPRKPPRPASMAGVAPRNHNGEKSTDSSIQMEDIHVTEPRYSEVPEYEPDFVQPKVQPTIKTNPSMFKPVESSSIEPKVHSTTETSPNRYSSEPPQNRSTQSQSPAKNSVRTEPLSKEERKKAVLANKIKAALVVFLLLVALAIALGIGARNASMVSFSGAFSKNKGKQCVHMCRNMDRYPTSPLVVIALNGFQSNFFQYQSLVSNIARLAECGVHGNTISSYPSTAIPDLYSIVTGIYPAYHGKAADWLRVYGLNETEFGPAERPNTYSRIDPKWFQQNGLWGIAADQGHLTASHSWIGREGNIDEDQPPSPSYYQTYDSGISYRDRIQTVVNWLHLNPSERPDFITVYFEDPGVTVQKYGIESDQTMDSLAKVDSAIGILLDSLFEEMDLGCINVMVVSTGGFADRNCDRTYYLIDDLPNVGDFSLLPDSVTSVGKITATDRAPLEMDTAEEIMEHLQCKVNHGQVFTKRLLPVQLHASYGLQYEDAVVLMEEGWTFSKQQEGYDRTNCKGASDGFNPYSSNMQGMFVGFGKGFKTAKTVPAVRNVDLFNLMAELVNVTPGENNGTAGIFSNVLTSPKMQDTVAVEFSSPRNAECSYPGNDNEYDQRQLDSDTGCVCTQAVLNSYPETREVTLKDINNNLRQTNVPASRQRNAPFGFPRISRNVGSTGQDYCELYQSNFITVYENKLKIPLFATFTVQRNSGTTTLIGNCLRYDVRLQPDKSPKCSNYDSNSNPQLPINIVQGLLYDPSLADSVNDELNALTSANIIPQYAAFQQNVWLPLAARIRQWANQSNRSLEMNVVVGPVYDWNSDTLQDTYKQLAASQAWVVDTPVPSHYFIVASRCKEDISLTMCSLHSLEVVSFVLPNTDTIRICKTFDDYLWTHMTSLQDLELITGLQLFPDMSADEELKIEFLQFKTKMPTTSPWMA
ncbi:venom phosphodiesterase 2-like isoform X2 [Acanthaster planci]|uniref:Venom phosphodiesterase 2-like isoform X2 n=1 Tax=Acanthaster planci TaxID=133434 RepID=A0A8B7YBS5_ACAPL|nr:venom phosphodiesterase 2-like isoform X2 [Acanthaster planci]